MKSKTDYRGAFLAVAKVRDREAALNMCLVHAGLRPGYLDEPGDAVKKWERDLKKALKVAATYGLDLKASWSLDKRYPGALLYTQGEPDANKMSQYEIGLALGFPEEVCGKLGTLKNRVYGVHFMIGKTHAVYFVAWEVTDSLLRYVDKQLNAMKRFVDEARLPFKGAYAVVTQCDRNFRSTDIHDYHYVKTLVHKVAAN